MKMKMKIIIIMKNNNHNEIQNKINFIEVCSGAGGLSSGFIKCGFNPILLNDNNKQCIETLKNNHKGVNIFNGNMTDIDLTKYKNIDILAGGVPCQSFSLAGNREGLEDDRGKLMLYFIKMIEIIKPKLFIIFNNKSFIIEKCKRSCFS